MGEVFLGEQKGISRPSLLQPQQLGDSRQSQQERGAEPRGKGAAELWGSSLEMETFLEKKATEKCEKVSLVEIHEKLQDWEKDPKPLPL